MKDSILLFVFFFFAGSVLDVIVCIQHSRPNKPAALAVLKTLGGPLCEGMGTLYQYSKCSPYQCNYSEWYKRQYIDSMKLHHLHKHKHQHNSSNHSDPHTNSSALHHSSGHRIVLSYVHNGFANQLFQNSYAQRLAEQLHAKFYYTKIPLDLSPNNVLPPNTFFGYRLLNKVMNNEFKWDKLPENHPEVQQCLRKNLTIFVRPRDLRAINSNQQMLENLDSGLVELEYLLKRYQLNETASFCIVSLGYFEKLVPCRENAIQMYSKIFTLQNVTNKMGPDDFVVYFRCVNHYHAPSEQYLEAILNNSRHEKVWILKPPGGCAGPFTKAMTFIQQKYNATVWSNGIVSSPSNNPSKSNSPSNQTSPVVDDLAPMIVDFLALATAKKIITVESTWSFWSAYLSNASEIHADLAYHQIVPLPNYYYHQINNDKKRSMFFGRYNVSTKKINFFGRFNSSTQLVDITGMRRRRR